MKKRRTNSFGFTVIELLVVIGIISILAGLLIPAIGRTRDSARLSQSLTNLRNLATAHSAYAATFNDRQFTQINDNLASYGNSAQEAITNFYQQNPGGSHPSIVLGRANGPNDSYANWQYFINPSLPFNLNLAQPMTFSGSNLAFGSFRLINVRRFNTFLNGRFYDRVFYAPKDMVVVDAVDNPVGGAGNGSCFDNPGEFCIRPAVGTNDIPVWSSYITSPAAMFAPQVMAASGWRNPWSLNGGFRSPSMGHALHPSLKTHMIEHHWLQNARGTCNPGFGGPTPYGRNCEPYYFNHGFESAPAALFYDGSIRTVSTRLAQNSDTRVRQQSGQTNGLWHREAGALGENGYFIDRGYDMSATSYHVLTVEGIRGRDIVSASGG